MKLQKTPKELHEALPIGNEGSVAKMLKKGGTFLSIMIPTKILTLDLRIATSWNPTKR